jgi:hypothetical protein
VHENYNGSKWQVINAFQEKLNQEITELQIFFMRFCVTVWEKMDRTTFKKYYIVA